MQTFRLALSFQLLAACIVEAQFVNPGSLWLDNRGEHIQAHGGGVIKLGDTWYWFGEDYTPTNDPDKRYIACYSSTNLVDWAFRNQVVQWANPHPEDLSTDWVLQRPKVFYNTNTEQYVMYMHLDDDLDYHYAHVAVATCDTVDGNYTYQRDFQPLGCQSRDIGQFIDDGTAYLIFEDRPNGFHIAKLSDDYLDVASDVCLITNHLEGGALVHYEGLYYVMGSHLTGWDPNVDVYATATNLAGPWSAFQNFAPTNLNTYGSQSTMLLKVVGSNTTTVLYLGDMWRPDALWDSRYLWMPLQIGGGNLSLPRPYSWTIDIGSGVATDALPTLKGTLVKLNGTIIGTPGSWQDLGNTISNVFDGDLATFFDGPDSSGGSNCWAGLDLGSAQTIAAIKYCPRPTSDYDYASLMIGGKFQGADTPDFSDAEDLFTVNIEPPTNVMTTQVVVNPTPFRYVRYLSPVDGWGNVSEVEFDMLLSNTHGTFLKLGGTIIGTPGSWQDLGNTISNVFDGDLATFFDGLDSSGGSNCWVGLDLGAGNARPIAAIKYCPRPDYPDRMVGGQFQGANLPDFSDAETLFTVISPPPTNVMTTQVVVNPTPFRYVRYFSPVGGYGNVSEVEFDMFRPQLHCELQKNQFQLNWITNYGVWRLQTQTNLSDTNWWDAAGANATNPISIFPVGAQCYYRLIYP